VADRDAEIARLNTQIGDLNTRIATLQGQVDTLTADKAALQAQVNTLTAQNTALQGQVSSLTSQNTALQGQVSTLTSQNAALTADNQQLRQQVAAAAVTINALVSDIFGGKPTAAVALAARDMAQAELAAAKAAAPNDPKLKQAQKAFDAGLADLNGGNYQQAVQGFNQAYDTAHKILTR
jgi:chromosome segregation ATPase